MWSQSDVLESEEALPITLDGLQRWQVAERLLAAQLAGTGNAQRRHGWARCPRTRSARACLTPSSRWCGRSPRRRRPTRAVRVTYPVDVLLPDGRRVRGATPAVHGDRAMTVTYSTVGAKQLLRAWVDLLALACSDAGRTWRAVVVGRGGRSWTGPVLRHAHHGQIGLVLPVEYEAQRRSVALVHARFGDRHGNLVYEKSAQNFNPLCAAAGRVTIAEVEELLEPGELDPALVHTPGIFVRRVVHVPDGEKRTVSGAHA